MESRFITSLVLAAACALPLGAAGMDTSPSPGASKGATAPDSAPPAKSGASGPVSATFRQLDADKDGYISLDEAKKSAAISKRFKELDMDRDGKLSEAELNAATSPAAGGASGSTGSSPKQKY